MPGRKLPEIRDWLKSRGVAASISCMANFLANLRTRRVPEIKADDPRSIEYFPEAKREVERMQKRFAPRADRPPRKLKGFSHG